MKFLLKHIRSVLSKFLLDNRDSQYQRLGNYTNIIFKFDISELIKLINAQLKDSSEPKLDKISQLEITCSVK